MKKLLAVLLVLALSMLDPYMPAHAESTLLGVFPDYFQGNFKLFYNPNLYNQFVENSSGDYVIQATEKAPIAPTVALAGAGAGNIENGTHSYRITFITAGGETEQGTASSQVTVVDKTINGQVALSAIPTGSSFVTSRKIYRTIAGDTGSHKLVATIADNTTTTYTDNTADGSLGAVAPTKNTAVDTRFTLKNNGQILVSGGSLLSNSEMFMNFSGHIAIPAEGTDFMWYDPTKAITVTKLSVIWQTAGTGGTTGVRFQVSDGVTPVTCDVPCTAASGVKSLCNVTDTNYAAGADVAVQITAATDCTVNPQTITVNAEYKMQ